jgi:hypothetical protein
MRGRNRRLEDESFSSVWILMAVCWRVLRSSTHFATGKRCLADLALITALCSVFDAKASSIADLNWCNMCLVVVDSTVNHHPGI